VVLTPHPLLVPKS